jgi:hypothetical protein
VDFDSGAVAGDFDGFEGFVSESKLSAARSPRASNCVGALCYPRRTAGFTTQSSQR